MITDELVNRVQMMEKRIQELERQLQTARGRIERALSEMDIMGAYPGVRRFMEEALAALPAPQEPA